MKLHCHLKDTGSAHHDWRADALNFFRSVSNFCEKFASAQKMPVHVFGVKGPNKVCHGDICHLKGETFLTRAFFVNPASILEYI